jgi:hypothetical protein
MIKKSEMVVFVKGQRIGALEVVEPLVNKKVGSRTEKHVRVKCNGLDGLECGKEYNTQKQNLIRSMRNSMKESSCNRCYVKSLKKRTARKMLFNN